jgi:hypothetical protein
MWVIWIVVWIICTTCLAEPILASEQALPDSAQADSLKKAEPDFSNVTVLVETEWGPTDKQDGVDVFVIMKGKKPVEIEMIKGIHQKCSVSLMSGVTVKILDSKTGQLLKKY